MMALLMEGNLLAQRKKQFRHETSVKASKNVGPDDMSAEGEFVGIRVGDVETSAITSPGQNSPLHRSAPPLTHVK